MVQKYFNYVHVGKKFGNKLNIYKIKILISVYHDVCITTPHLIVFRNNLIFLTEKYRTSPATLLILFVYKNTMKQSKLPIL